MQKIMKDRLVPIVYFNDILIEFVCLRVNMWISLTSSDPQIENISVANSETGRGTTEERALLLRGFMFLRGQNASPGRTAAKEEQGMTGG